MTRERDGCVCVEVCGGVWGCSNWECVICAGKAVEKKKKIFQWIKLDLVQR